MAKRWWRGQRRNCRLAATLMIVEHQAILQALHAAKLADLNTLRAHSHQALANQQRYLAQLQDAGFDAKTIAQACSEFYQLPYLSQIKVNFNEKYFSLIEQFILLPLDENETEIHLAIADPYYFLHQHQLEINSLKKLKFFLIDYQQLIKSANYYLNSMDLKKQTADRIARQILQNAIHLSASDIHIEPQAEDCRLRLRLDGLLHTQSIIDAQITASLINHIKIVAGLDIAEKRLPQDGRFQFLTHSGIKKDCRISSCPGLFGEKIVIRILYAHRKLLQLDELGLNFQQKNIFLQQIKKPQGLILVTGPTGSGKTITLYTALNLLNCSTKNIATVEDPIEIHLPGIHQVNIHNKANLDFSTILRAFLRQDPDMIIVGEIRDLETAQIAIRAAQTGHLVLATLHTNSAIEAISRLINMGIAAYQLSACLNFVIAQRLLRRCCAFCHNGCEQCHAGFKGRIGIFECLAIDENLAELINQNASVQKLKHHATKIGMQTLQESAQEKIAIKLSTEAELERVLA